MKTEENLHLLTESGILVELRSAEYRHSFRDNNSVDDEDFILNLCWD